MLAGRRSPDSRLAMYVVYRHPRDYPGKWVVRLWWVGKPGELEAAVEPSIVADTLEEARAIVPPYLERLRRKPGDDPVIYETWL
jgi:hypothetical protein